MCFIYTMTANFCARYVMNSLWNTLFRPWSDEISMISQEKHKTGSQYITTPRVEGADTTLLMMQQLQDSRAERER